MAEEETPPDETPKKKSKMPLILGLVLALAGGGGGFFAVYSGMLLGGESASKDKDAHAEETAEDDHGTYGASMSDIAFIPIDPLVISLNSSQGTHLRFRAQLEVKNKYKSDVEYLLPRVVDVLNGYLRAIDLADLQDNAALVRLRAQMLRRVQVVVGKDRINDLLIMEFVLN